MLDTSAVIGWVELQSPELLAHLRDRGEDAVPRIHTVVLGELERGVASAPDDAIASRRTSTLTFARDDLAVTAWEAGEQAHLFGLVSASISRKLSQNDCWIAAAAIAEGCELVTQDRNLADRLNAAAAGDSALAGWLRARDRVHITTYCPR